MRSERWMTCYLWKDGEWHPEQGPNYMVAAKDLENLEVKCPVNLFKKIIAAEPGT